MRSNAIDSRSAQQWKSRLGRHGRGLMTSTTSGSEVPPRSLAISLVALAVPVLATLLLPGWVSRDLGMLVWLTALIPAFLLSYHRGWWGVSVALAMGMAALALTQVVVVLLDMGNPDWGYVLAAVVTYIIVCLGAGFLAGRLHKAAELALTDELTGLPNRRHLSLFLETTFAAAERGHAMTVVLFDLDDFKVFNDQHGHVAGDEVLEKFGEILQKYTRKMNLTARYGGEEFISVLANSRLEGAEIFVSRILEAVRSTTFPGGPVTASAGIAEYEPGMGSPEVLIAAADRALYECKKQGGNGYRVAPRTLLDEDPLLEAHRSEQASRRGDEEGTGASGSRAAASEPLPRGHEAILLAERDPDARRAMTALLERLGYRVTGCVGGKEALARLGEMPATPRLLVTDLELGDMSGFTLAERMEGITGDLRVVYISGRAHGEVLWRGAPGTIREFVYKPFDAAELAQKVRLTLNGQGRVLPDAPRGRGGPSRTLVRSARKA